MSDMQRALLRRPRTRREFLQTSTGAALAATLPGLSAGWTGLARQSVVPSDPTTLITLRDPRVQALAQTALDAAVHAGAHYADVRLTSTTTRELRGGLDWYEQIVLGLSVRALVDGYWGWAATPYLAPSEAPRVGRHAVLLAKANAASGLPRTVDWAPAPVVVNGDWATPITIDPFELAMEEISDWSQGLAVFCETLARARGSDDIINPIPLHFQKQERWFASTEGSTLFQRISLIEPRIQFAYKRTLLEVDLGPAQAGWEYVARPSIRDLVRQTMDQYDRDITHRLPNKPVEVGRYDLVCTAPVIAALLGQTLGAATELDRALGYEANAGGTSYLGPDPLALLGSSVATPLLTVTADRSTPQALATVQWDDEGVVPKVFPVVKDGVLVDYQTTREQAAWLAPWYAKRGLPLQSHGCAASEDALTLTMQHTPNLVMQPGTTELGVEELVQSVDRGYVLEAVDVDTDFQHLAGLARGELTEIRHGKRVARVKGAGFLFRSPELWHALKAIGGPASRRWSGERSEKGDPSQQTLYSIAAVPALIAQQAVINPRNKV